MGTVEIKDNKKRWSTAHEQAVIEILTNQSQINVTEFARGINFQPSSIKRHISRIAATMGLRIVGISNRDICDIKKAVNDKYKKLNTDLSRFICMCNGPGGTLSIKVSAMGKADAKRAVEGEYPALTVTHVMTQDEHAFTHKIKSTCSSVVRDVNFGKSRSRRSIL
jgi:hypothetical protein